MQAKVIENKNVHIISFFGLTFLISWSVWIPAGLFAPEQTALVLPGAWSPTIAALILTGFTTGKQGLKTLLKSVIKWRVHLVYYLFAILGILSVAILAIFVNLLFGGSLPEVGSIAANFGFPEDQAVLFLLFSPVVFLTTIFIGGPIAEELGWRGYAQPKLQEKIGAGNAGLVIGLIWSIWHVPLFIYFPAATGHLPIGYYIPLVTLLGVLFAWIYNRSNGSVLLCILLHAGVNFSVGVLGSDILTGDTRLLTIFVLLIALLVISLYKNIQSIRGRHFNDQKNKLASDQI